MMNTVDALLDKATRIFDIGGLQRHRHGDPHRAALHMMRAAWRETATPFTDVVQREIASEFPAGVPALQVKMDALRGALASIADGLAAQVPAVRHEGGVLLLGEPVWGKTGPLTHMLLHTVRTQRRSTGSAWSSVEQQNQAAERSSVIVIIGGLDSSGPSNFYSFFTSTHVQGIPIILASRRPLDDEAATRFRDLAESSFRRALAAWPSDQSAAGASVLAHGGR